MKLDDWCKENPDKVAKLRKSVSCSPKRWFVYRRGAAIPREKPMRQIARGTDYQVTANDYYGIDPMRAAEAAMRTAAA